MSLLLNLLDAALTHSQATMYFVLAGTYGAEFWAARCGRHAPCHIYLASCLVHATLGVLHTLSLG
jgi:hypothetical protein